MIGRPADLPVRLRCTGQSRSSGLRMSSITADSRVGRHTTATTSRVHTHAGPNSHPPASKASSAGATRLRRRMSKSFHSDRAESGFACRFPFAPFGPGGARPARQQPAGKLPVAAYPAVAPAGLDGIAGRMLLDEVDIGHQRRTRIAAFQQGGTEEE